MFWWLSDRARVALAFATIFIVWGSTYLGIRYAVAEIPPFLTAGTRHFVAGAALLAWARYRRLGATATEWFHSAVAGMLFFLVGHGTLHWAEQTVPSGLSALLVATEPVWIAVIMAVIGDAPLRLKTLVGLLLGLAGVWMLVRVDAALTDRAQVLGAIAVLVGAAGWGAGVVYTKHASLPGNPMLRTATTLLCGSGWLLGTSLVLGEPARLHAPSPLAIGSLAFLILFGSIAAFTAYYWLLDRYPATLVATHTYVNPAVAVALGWAFAGEAVSPTFLAALVVIVLAIALVGESPSLEHVTSAIKRRASVQAG